MPIAARGASTSTLTTIVQLAHFVEVITTEMQGFGRISDMLRCINVSLTIC